MTWHEINEIGGVQSVLSYSGGDVWTHVGLPETRQDSNGTRPIIVNEIGLYVSGYGGARSGRMWVSNGDGNGRASSGLFSIPNESTASTRRHAGLWWGISHMPGQIARMGWITEGGGLARYGHNSQPGVNVYQGGSVLQSGRTLAGGFNYLQVPSSPGTPNVVGVTPAVALVSWATPADDGGTAITGYVVQWSKAADFSSGVGALTVGVQNDAYINFGSPGTWYARVFALNAVTAGFSVWGPSSGIGSGALIKPPDEPGNIDSWQKFGPAWPSNMQDGTPVGLRRAIVETAAGPRDTILKENYVTSGAVGLLADLYGAKRQIVTIPGRTYRFTAWGVYTGDEGSPVNYQIGVIGDGWGEPVTFGPKNYPRLFPTYEWVATGGTAEIAFRMTENVIRNGYAAVEKFGIFSITVEELPPSVVPLRLASTVYEGSLAAHFDLANNSVGARWWVDSFGVTQFAAELNADQVVAEFTDERAEGRLEYVDISTSFDTRDIVNDLAVTNVGAKLGADGWEDDDVTTAYQNVTSIASYGPRSADVELNLYDQDDYAGSVALRADQIMEGSETLERRVTRIRWNAQEDPVTAAKLEVYSPVNVWRRGTMYPCRVVGIDHEMTPTRWIITLDLIER